MVFTLFMLVVIAFSGLSFETLKPTISCTIVAVITRICLCYFWCHMQSKRWLPQTTVAVRIWNLLLGSFLSYTLIIWR